MSQHLILGRAEWDGTKVTERAQDAGFRRKPLIFADHLVSFEVRTPQSAHHPHKNHDEHRQCNPGGGIHFAVLLGSENLYTTPFEIPFLIRSPLWWRHMVGDPLLLEIQAFGGRRKPQIFAENQRFSQKTVGNRGLGSVTFGPSP